MLFCYLLLLLNEKGWHIATAATMGTIIWWIIWTTLLLSFLLLPLEFIRKNSEFFYWVIVGIIPPLILPIGWSSKCLLAKACIFFPSFDLNAVCSSMLVFTQSTALLPPHLSHYLTCVITFNGDIGDSWALEKSVAVFGSHQQTK